MDQSLRELFPVLKRKINGHSLVYLDTAATSLKPIPVIDILSNFYLEEYATVHRAIYTLSISASEKYEQSRKRIAQFLNASSEEVIFTRGTTDSLNLAANILAEGILTSGDEILITAMEHHSNIVPWQMMAAKKGAKLVVAPIFDNGELDLSVFQNLLTPKTKIVALPHISNVLGTVNPIEEIVSLSHKIGAIVVVDGAQGAPHLPVDVQKMGCDFYAFSGHKIYGPNGIGILYGRRELLEKLPPYQGGGDMIDKVTFEKTTYNVPPLKFEAGTPIIAEAIALGAAIDFLQQNDLKAVGEQEKHLSEMFREGLKTFPGIKIIGEAKERSGITSFVFEGIHPLDLATLLDLEGIAIRTGHLCAQPLLRRFGLESISRASFGIYNTEEDVERLLSSLKTVLKKLS